MFPLLWPAIAGLLALLVTALVGRVILALGISFVTYMGIEAGIDYLESLVVQKIMGLPVDLMNLVGFLWIDKALTVVFSAYAAAAVIKFAGNVKKMVFK